MASIQHVYRRGHIFWWRRVLCIHGESGCDIRLSLGTADRRRARELGAMLTAASEGVTMFVEEQARRRADEPAPPSRTPEVSPDIAQAVPPNPPRAINSAPGRVQPAAAPTPSRDAYEEIFAALEMFDLPVVHDPVARRYKLADPPPEWLPVLFSPAYADETERRLSKIGLAQVEIPKLEKLIEISLNKPRHVELEAGVLKFPRLEADERALLEKYRASERIQGALEFAKELYEQAEAERLAALVQVRGQGRYGR